MQTLTPMFGSGVKYDLPADQLENFKADFGKEAEDGVSMRTKDGKSYTIPRSQQAAFVADFPDAQEVRDYQMADGRSFTANEDAMRQLAKDYRGNVTMSRGYFEKIGLPQGFGRSANDRMAIADEASKLYPPDAQQLGVLGTIQAQKQQELGAEVSQGRALASMIPGVGSILDAGEKGKESNERRLYNGDFRDTLEAGRLALAVGVPEEKIREINAAASEGLRRNAFGGAMEPERIDVAKQMYHDLLNDALAQRIKARAEAGEKLSGNEVSFLEKVGIGALGLGKTVGEMASAPVAAATLGASAMDRAATMKNVPMSVDENGNVIAPEGESGDKAMLKGFGGAAAERAIWMGLGKLPGGDKVAKMFEGGFIRKNAGELGGMMLKTRLTDLVDNVMGANVAEGDTANRKALSTWAKEFISPTNNMELLLELMPAHFGMKGLRRISPSGVAQARNAREMREKIASYVGGGRVKDFSDQDIRNLYGFITSPHLTEERVKGFMDNVAKDMKRGGATEAIDRNIDEASVQRMSDKRAAVEAERAAAKARGEAAEAEKQSVADERRAVEAKMAENEQKAATKEHHEKSIKGGEERAQRKAEMAEYERQEAERKAREIAEEQAVPEMRPDEPTSASAAEPQGEATSLRDTPEYKAWLKKQGRTDTDKNWNKYVATHDLDPALKVERGRDAKPAEKPVEAKAEKPAAPAETPSAPTAEQKSAVEPPKAEAKPAAPIATESAKVSQTPAPAPKPKPVADTLKSQSEAEIVRDAMKSDPALQKIDAAYKAAKTDAERNALQEQFKARVAELREAKAAAGDKVVMEDATPAPAAPAAEVKKPDGKGRVRKTAQKPPKTPAEASAPKAGQAPAPTAAKSAEPAKRTPDGKGGVKGADATPAQRLANLKAEERADRKAKKAESQKLVAEIDATIAKHEPVEGSKKVYDEMFSKWKEIDAKRRRIEAKLTESNVFGGYGISDSQVRMRASLSTDGKAVKSRMAELKELDRAAREIENQMTGLPNSDANVVFRVGENGTFTIKNDPFTLRKFRDRVESGYKEAGKRYYDTAEADRIESLRSDPAVRKWVEDGRRGEVVDGKVSPRNVVDYLRDQVDKAVTATRRVFSDAKVEVKDRDFNPLIDEKDGATTFKAADGRVVGTFDPATKHVTLYRGADAKTVIHELIGHGVEDWAARNNKPLHDKLMELAKTAPKELTDAIRERYPDADEATLAKEIIANIAEGKGLDRIKLKEAPKAWYAKAYVAVRDALLGFMEKIGLRRVDLSKIDEMSPNEAMDHLMDEIAKGKTLGEIGAASDGKVGIAEKWADAFWKRHASLEKIDKNAAYAKQTQPGKEAAFQNLVYNKRVGEMKKMLADGDVAIESVDELMKATAALERNKADRAAHVQRLLNEGMPKNMAEEKADILINKLNQGTSGMSDAVAEATIKHYEGSAKFAEIKKVADFLWKIQDEGMRERVRAGLVAQKDYDGWKAKEPHHVPFRSAVDETTGEWVNGWARGMESPEFIQHQGRFSESGSPSTWILQEFSNAFMRGIENDTRLVLAKAVETNPALGKIVESPTLREFNGKEGDPNVVSYKTINDKGESVTRHIYLNGERGAMAASSYTNAKMTKVNKLAARAMRIWAATATELSPTFALRNFSADNLGFAKMVLLERGAKDGGRFLKDYAKNHKAVAREVWDFVRNGNVDENSTLGQYMKSGAMIGGFQREGYTDIKDAFSAKAIAKEFAAGRNRGAAIVRNTLGLVKAINGYSELANRVADFKTRLEWGEDMKTVVKQSREDFVDFNQKGNLTPLTNTLFMFSNSTIGATMRQLQAANKSLRTWEGRRALLGLAVFGAAEAAIEHFWNAQQDADNEKKGEATGKDVNEHTRKVSLYFRHGGNVYRLPVHEDPLMRVVYAANATMRWKLGDMDGKTFAKEILGDIAGDIPAYFGMGTKEMSAGVNTWLPSALQPFAQHFENKDYAGRPIYRPKFNEAMPDSQNGRQSTSEVYKWIAETLNAATGGNEGRKGAVDIAPETAKLVTESVVKNMGKDLANAADTGWRILTGDFKGIDSRRVPVVRDIVRKSEGNDNRYFEAARRYDDDAHEWKTMKAEWTPEERRAYIKEHPWVRRDGDKSPVVQRLKTEVNKLRRMESGQRRRKDGSWTKAEYTEEQLTAFRAKRLKKQSRLIELMDSAAKK